MSYRTVFLTKKKHNEHEIVESEIVECKAVECKFNMRLLKVRLLKVRLLKVRLLNESGVKCEIAEDIFLKWSVVELN